MHAYLHSTRLAPKKANIMAKMVRGMTVPDAMELLRRTSKKSASVFEQVLRSAIANAEHNYKQDAQSLILKTVIVNQGAALRRGIPMARGRVRPIKKFMSHISITLGFPEIPASEAPSTKHQVPNKSKAPNSKSQGKDETKKDSTSNKPVNKKTSKQVSDSPSVSK